METQPPSIFDNLKGKSISASSLALYMNNLKRLNGGQEIKNFNFLKDTEKILDRIKDYKPNTRRTYIISIVSLLKQEPKLKKLYDKYYSILMDYNSELKTNTTKSETQEKNWISQDEVKEIYNAIFYKVEPSLSFKKLKEAEFNMLMNWVILSLYVLQPPRRNIDYLLMKIVKKLPAEMDKAFNYLALDDMKFHFNNYKTKGTYQTQTVDISPELQTVIKQFLPYHPQYKDFKKKGGIDEMFLIVNQAGTHPEAKNYITRVLNKLFDKKIGVSMLRNIYLTSKYGVQNGDKAKDATDMGTSVNMIDNQYTKQTEGENSPQ